MGRGVGLNNGISIGSFPLLTLLSVQSSISARSDF